jgi:hypothetical protein
MPRQARVAAEFGPSDDNEVMAMHPALRAAF